eukprot:TRINITY_DN24791_c0_g1_i1.p1 TRINITY_DN24791_c0_g1~~TRINITY_DN24791_c0_g1_i1.p1  ORF type:complete len:708 (+),score=126.51 TRINITY_DN24791_c0_g1_i1:80-2203(+)
MKTAVGILALAVSSQAADVLKYTTSDCTGATTTTTLTHEGLVGGTYPQAKCVIAGGNSRRESSTCSGTTLSLTDSEYTGVTDCSNTPTSTTYIMDGACHTTGTTSYKSQYSITCTESRYYKYDQANCAGNTVTESGFTPVGVSEAPCSDNAVTGAATKSRRFESTCSGNFLVSTLRTWTTAAGCPAAPTGSGLSLTHNGECDVNNYKTIALPCDSQSNGVTFYASADCSGAAAETLRHGTKFEVQADRCEPHSTLDTSKTVTWNCPEYTSERSSTLYGTVTVVDYSSRDCSGTSTSTTFSGDNTCTTTTYKGHGSYRLNANVVCQNILRTTFTTSDCTLRPSLSTYTSGLSSTGCVVSGIANSVYTEHVCSAETGHMIVRKTTYTGSTTCRTISGNTAPAVEDSVYSGECVQVSSTSSYKNTKILCNAKRTVSIYPTADCTGPADANSGSAYTYFNPAGDCKTDNTISEGSYRESLSCSSDGFAMTTVTKWEKDSCDNLIVSGVPATHSVKSFYVADAQCHRLVGHPTGHSYKVSGGAARCGTSRISTYMDNNCGTPYTHSFTQDTVDHGSCMANEDGTFTRQDTTCPTGTDVLVSTRNWYDTNGCISVTANNIPTTTTLDGECYRATLADGTKVSQRGAKIGCSVPDTAPLPYDDSDDDKAGIIAGSVIGGTCFLCIVGFVIYKFCCSGGDENSSKGAPDDDDEEA